MAEETGPEAVRYDVQGKFGEFLGRGREDDLPSDEGTVSEELPTEKQVVVSRRFGGARAFVVERMSDAVRYLDHRTASSIAFALLIILAAVIWAQYNAIWEFAANNEEGIKVFQDFFDQVFPAITGLVGAVTAYYFSSRDKQSDRS